MSCRKPLQSPANTATCRLAQLQESPTNPRRRFDERALEELAASLQARAFCSPCLSALDDDKYEVIAGARRFRAAKLASLVEVPVRVVDSPMRPCVKAS